VTGRRRALPHDLIGLVDLEARQLQVINHPLGELLAGIIGHVLLEEPAQKIAAAGDRKADREGELIAGSLAPVLFDHRARHFQGAMNDPDHSPRRACSASSCSAA
jgi:hypothetical protein